jgi:hypothetical protein
MSFKEPKGFWRGARVSKRSSAPPVKKHKQRRNKK